jgi:hypothetical protein
MKRFVIVVAGALMVLPVPAWAEKNPAVKPVVPAANPAADLVKEAEAKLRGTVWMIKLTPIGGSSGAAKEDRLNFAQGKIASDKMISDGFPASNYTLTVGDDLVPVWETMQSGGDKGVAFWRGELHGEIMRGILSKHLTQGGTEDYSFSGSKTEGAPVIPEAKPPTPAPAPESAPAAAISPAATDAPAAASEPAAPAPIVPVPAVPAPAPAAVRPAAPAPAPTQPAAPAQSQQPAPKKKGWLW